jgi:hypothetical protein
VKITPSTGTDKMKTRCDDGIAVAVSDGCTRPPYLIEIAHRVIVPGLRRCPSLVIPGLFAVTLS